MNSKHALLTALLLILSFGSLAEERYRDAPTAEASALVKQYLLSDEPEKALVLAKIEAVAQQNPVNVNVIRIYTSLLSSTGEYLKATDYLEKTNKVNPTSALLLHECMLKERTGDMDVDCYKKVILLSERHRLKNMDYVMALYFSNDERFEMEKNALIKRDESLRGNFDAFTQDKESLLKTLYP